MHMQRCAKQTFTAVGAFGLIIATAASAWAVDHVVSSGFNLVSKLSLSVGFDCANSPSKGEGVE
jgi:hypothetical protein